MERVQSKDGTTIAFDQLGEAACSTSAGASSADGGQDVDAGGPARLSVKQRRPGAGAHQKER
jgi:hypothetical protein